MADPEHLTILKRGVQTWNRWREINPEIKPDLIEADLNHLNLSYANLGVANLERASLVSSNFSQADLSWANLSQADFSNASLINVNLNSATLSDANLCGAFILWANFAYADLNRALFQGASLGNIVFGDTSLREAVGLDSCHYVEPCIIDHQTLMRSGPLPLNFLRGCGLPDDLIEYFLSESAKFYSCFISYSHHDQAFAQRLYVDLQNNGVRCWFAEESLRTGDRIRPVIDESIRLHDKLLLVLSQHSLTSQWVEAEVETALERERDRGGAVLFPIRLDDTVMQVRSGWPSLIRNTRNIGDFSGWRARDVYARALDKLLRDLKLQS